MAYPYGMNYSRLTFSQPLTASGDEADRTEITITPTHAVLWADSGRPLETFTETVQAAMGQSGSVTAPHVNQPGFRDKNGQAFTGWAYRVERTAYFGKQKKSVVRLWSPLVGQDTADFDALPDTDPSDPLAVDAPQVLSVAGATGAIGIDFLAERLTPWMDAKVAAGVDLDGLVPVVEAAVRDPFSGLRDAVDDRAAAAAAPKLDAATAASTYAAKSVETSKLDASARGAVNGVASLDADTKVPVSQVPDAVKPDAGGKPVGKGELVVNAKDYGVVGDGVANDTTAIKAAFAAAGTLKRPLLLVPNSVINVNSPVTAPAGLVLHANNATLKLTQDMGRSSILILTDKNTVVGNLNIMGFGGLNQCGVAVQGNNVRIDSLNVESPTAGAGSGNTRNNGVQLSNFFSGVSIGTLKVKNFDFAVRVENYDNITIDHLEIENYCTGFWVTAGKKIWINGGWASGKSPNSIYTPGHNGVLMGGTSNHGTSEIYISNFTVRDSGEHGYRIAGPFVVSRVHFTNCAAIKVGGTGFKCLPDPGTPPYEELFYTNCVAEDVGLLNQNCCGFIIEQSKGVKITNCVVRKRDQANSSSEGMRFTVIEDLTVADCTIRDFINNGIRISPELGACKNVVIRNTHIESSSGHCINFDFTTAAFINMNVLDCYLEPNNALNYYAIALQGAANNIGGTCEIRFRSTKATVIDPAATTTPFYANIIAPKAGTKVFKNGSEWIDVTTGTKFLAKAGAWVAL